MRVKKKFSIEDYNKYNQPAFDAAQKYLKDNSNLSLTQRIHDKRGIDGDLWDEDRAIKHMEFEIKDDSGWWKEYKKVWTKTHFPWSTVHFTWRKLEHLINREGGYDLNGDWVLLNMSCRQHLVVRLADIDALYNARLKIELAGGPKALTTVYNIIFPDGEEMLDIPMSMVDLNGLDRIIEKCGIKKQKTANDEINEIIQSIL